MRAYSIAVIPGDGIGPEIIAEGIKVLSAAAELEGADIRYTTFHWGANYYLEHGCVVPEGGFETLKGYDAVYFGAAGDLRIEPGIIEHQLILAMRSELDQYVNLRPVKLLPGVRSPIAGVQNIDIQMVRENTEDFYIRTGAKFLGGEQTDVFHTTLERAAYRLDLDIRTKLSAGDTYAYNLGLVTAKGTERVSRYAFDLARRKGKDKVTIITKRNAVPQMYSVWEDVFFRVAEEYPEIRAEKLNVDAAAMYMAKDPAGFQVILAPNLFGDILSDLAAAVCGGLGFGGSGNIDPDGVSMFEPIHGSAPKYASMNVVNPIATIIAGALMMEHLGETGVSGRMERAVSAAMASGRIRSKDMGGSSSTSEIGDIITEYLDRV